MSRERWGAPGISPFFTDRARSRAPQILSYAAVGGAALLVAPSGELVMVSGSVAGIDLQRVARLARGMSSTRGPFKIGDACVHAAPVTAGWTLCAIAVGIDPRIIADRLRRASGVMALALVDGGASGSGGSAPSGSPAEIAVGDGRPSRPKPA